MSDMRHDFQNNGLKYRGRVVIQSLTSIKIVCRIHTVDSIMYYYLHIIYIYDNMDIWSGCADYHTR